MTRKCELCATLKTRLSAAEHKPAKARRVLVEDRVLALCAEHAEQVKQRGPATLAELRQAFTERHGQRSLLQRRAPLDRRAFPARPEGRRASDGRRSSDSNQ
ncbi:MAG TPA: hypothetical protein VER12_13920 [Polyangiaceae bacterium]|nr:hypothetical protein [Polyangiaceae bacterium]HYQ29055.1 hypothetical protein [Polyangiaceae bacterium]